MPYTVEQYLELFESKVIIAGFEKQLLQCKRTFVPIANGKLDNTPFGSFIGNRFDYKQPLVIDYYGMLKKSSGFFIAKEKFAKEVEISRLNSDIIYFASIKIEHIVDTCKDLAVDFPGFKKYLVDLRGFKKKSKK